MTTITLRPPQSLLGFPWAFHIIPKADQTDLEIGVLYDSHDADGVSLGLGRLVLTTTTPILHALGQKYVYTLDAELTGRVNLNANLFTGFIVDHPGDSTKPAFTQVEKEAIASSFIKDYFDAFKIPAPRNLTSTKYHFNMSGVKVTPFQI